MVVADLCQHIQSEHSVSPRMARLRACESHNLAASVLVILCIWLFLCVTVRLDHVIALQ